MKELAATENECKALQKARNYLYCYPDLEPESLISPLLCSQEALCSCVANQKMIADKELRIFVEKSKGTQVGSEAMIKLEKNCKDMLNKLVLSNVELYKLRLIKKLYDTESN